MNNRRDFLKNLAASFMVTPALTKIDFDKKPKKIECQKTEKKSPATRICCITLTGSANLTKYASSNWMQLV